MTQIAIIGSDIQEIMGSAIAFRVLFGIPLWAGCLITGLDTLTFLAIQVTGVRKLEAVFGVLILTMCVCFFATFVTQLPDGELIAEGLFVPTVMERNLIQAVSIVGAIVMPHNIYLHSALVLSRDIDRSRPSKIREANKYFALEATLALFVSLLINCAIVSVFAHAFYSDTCANIATPLTFASGDVIEPPFACVPTTTDSSQLLYSTVACSTASHGIGTCRPIGLQGAASALEGVMGSSARVLWAVGLLAAGQSSTMTGTFAGQFVMEAFLHLQVGNVYLFVCCLFACLLSEGLSECCTSTSAGCMS
jgi:NRAMP (natural resistance-associated macrophage protein)-like metal ion transporter